MKKTILTAVTLVGLAFSASAITITHTHSQGFGPPNTPGFSETVSFNGGAFQSAYLGRFVMSVASATTLPANYPVYPYTVSSSDTHPYSFFSYCLEPGQSIGVGHSATYDFTIGPLAGTDGVTAPEALLIAELFGRYSPLLSANPTGPYTGGTFRTAAAALQLALWEINLDTGSGWDLNSGNMRVGGTAYTESGASLSANAVAILMLNSLDGTGPMASGLEGLRNADTQDVMIQRVPDGGATLVLLGLGSLGIASLRRRLAK